MCITTSNPMEDMLSSLFFWSIPTTLIIINIYLSKASTFYQKHKSILIISSVIIALFWIMSINYVESMTHTDDCGNVADSVESRDKICTSCSIRYTNNTTSKLDDIIYRLHYYCEDKDLTPHCCTDTIFTKCKKVSDCNSEDNSPDNPTWNICNQ